MELCEKKLVMESVMAMYKIHQHFCKLLKPKYIILIENSF